MAKPLHRLYPGEWYGGWMKKIIQISTERHKDIIYMFALCEDGSLWEALGPNPSNWSPIDLTVDPYQTLKLAQ